MPFEKGVSGNPQGRTPAHITAAKVRQSIAEDLPSILSTLLKMAKMGDIQAIKLLLDRVCPPIKPQALTINLPVNGTLAEQGNEIIKATLSGQIPPDIGSQLITALSNQGKLIELVELTERLERIERQLELKNET